ncbi:MAG: TolB family protein [Actinomycetota bacterium]
MSTNNFERVSVSGDGVDQGGSYGAEISGDGRYVAFLSTDDTLVEGDTNEQTDAFVRDRVARRTIRVSIASDGTQANDATDHVTISSDGRFVVFTSWASNLVPGDTNSQAANQDPEPAQEGENPRELGADIFLHDRSTGRTERLSVSSSGKQGNNFSWGGSISAGGRYVVFGSHASNLVNGDTNSRYDVFLRDRLARTTKRISVSSAEHQGNGDSWNPSISADGKLVAFVSIASNLVAGDRNGKNDVYVRDLRTGTTERISGDRKDANGASLDPAISADGRYITFWSTAANLVSGDTNHKHDVFLHDRTSHRTQCLSMVSGKTGNGDSTAPAISANGAVIVFESWASNIVADDADHTADVFVSSW